MKQCAICHESKPLEEFHKDKNRKDGRDSRCSQCKNKKYLAYYHEDPERKERIICHAKKYQHGEGRERSNATKSAYHSRHPKKRRAHSMVYYALKTGELHRGPCEVCGAEKVVGHHDDYDRPLEVRWFCEKHHKEWHLANGEGLNPD